MAKLAIFSLVLLGVVGPGQAEIVFGPNIYQRTSGPPDVYTGSFNGPAQPEPGWTIQVLNGNADGTQRISSAKILVDGQNILPGSFNQKVYEIRKDISDLIQPVNPVRIELGGAPSGFITVNVASRTLGNICLLCYKAANGRDVLLDWSGGPPCSGSGGGPDYTAVRSTSVLFASGNATLQDQQPPQTTTDEGALLEQPLYFYLVGDGSSSDPIPGDRTSRPCPPILSKLINTTRAGSPEGVGFDGETVVIQGACDPLCGNGTCFDLTPGKNIVEFNDERAVVTGSNGFDLTVTVPGNVTTGPVTVTVNGLRSNALPFTAVVPTGAGLTLQDISSMFFYEQAPPTAGNDMLYVADRGTNNRIYRFDFSTTPPTIFTGPFLANPIMSSKDADGNVVFVGGLENCSNQGILRRWDNDTSVFNPWRQIGCTACGCPAPREPIFTKAIAVDPTTPPLCAPTPCPLQTRTAVSVARTNCSVPLGCSANPNHTVYEFPGQVGLLDKDYGDTQGGPLPFSFPMGGGTPGGHVSGAKFTNDGKLLYITNGSQLRSISDVQVVSIIDSSFNSLAGIDVRETTGANPTRYVLAADRGAGAVYLINVNTPSTRVLVASGLNSPRAVAFANDPGTPAPKSFIYVAEANRIIRLPDPRLKLAPQLLNGGKVMISVRPDDPDDYPLRPLQLTDRVISLDFEYLPHPSDPVTLYMAVIDPPADTVYGTPAPDDNSEPPPLKYGVLSQASVTVGTDGKPTTPVDFTITGQFAGDNYRIVFSEEDFSMFPDARIIAHTGVLTAWKRIYFEADLMYKQGSLLAVNWSPATPNKVVVEDVADFNPFGGDAVLILNGQNTVGEQAVTTAVNTVTREITLDQDLTGPHSIADFAGVALTVPGVYEPQSYQLWRDVFEEDTFVEYRELPAGSNGVPRKPDFDSLGGDPNVGAFGTAYFAHAGQPNYVWLCSADTDVTPDVLGVANADFNVSYVFDGNIELTSCNPPAERKEVAVHEVAHQWRVNNPGDGHCLNVPLEGTGKCIMHRSTSCQENTDGDADFDRIGGFPGTADVYGVRHGIDGLLF